MPNILINLTAYYYCCKNKKMCNAIKTNFVNRELLPDFVYVSFFLWIHILGT